MNTPAKAESEPPTNRAVGSDGRLLLKEFAQRVDEIWIDPSAPRLIYLAAALRALGGVRAKVRAIPASGEFPQTHCTTRIGILLSPNGPEAADVPNSAQFRSEYLPKLAELGYEVIGVGAVPWEIPEVTKLVPSVAWLPRARRRDLTIRGKRVESSSYITQLYDEYALMPGQSRVGDDRIERFIAIASHAADEELFPEAALCQMYRSVELDRMIALRADDLIRHSGEYLREELVTALVAYLGIYKDMAHIHPGTLTSIHFATQTEWTVDRDQLATMLEMVKQGFCFVVSGFRCQNGRKMGGSFQPLSRFRCGEGIPWTRPDSVVVYSNHGKDAIEHALDLSAGQFDLGGVTSESRGLREMIVRLPSLSQAVLDQFARYLQRSVYR